MKAYQLKAAIKNHKPAVWRRCMVPGGITYSQLSLILTEVMGREEEADFEFEFYHRKIRFGESGEERQLKPDYSYSVAEASEFYIDELLDTEEWFSFYYGEQLKLRVTIEKRLEKNREKDCDKDNEKDCDKDAWPWIMDVKEVVEEGISKADIRENLRRINENLKKKYTIRYEKPEYKTRQQIQTEHQKGNFGLVGWKKAENDSGKIRHSGFYYLGLMGGILRKMTSQGEIAEELLSQEEQEFLAKAREIVEQKQMMGEVGAQEAQNPQRSETNSLSPEFQAKFREECQGEFQGERQAEFRGEHQAKFRGEYQAEFQGERRTELQTEFQDAISQKVQSENSGTKAGSDTGAKREANTGTNAGTNTGRISLTERLQWEDKDELMDLGKRLGLSGLSSLGKLRLAEKAANCLLTRDVMERYFIKQDERSIAAWEAAVAAGGLYQPLAEHVPLLERFYEDYYLAMYEDNSVEVPLSVAEKYNQMNTPEFRERRKRVSWMMACLRIHGMIYGAAPVSVVMRMYRKRAGYRLKQSEFSTVFRDIPEEDNLCELCGDMVIKKSLLENGYYERIEKMQEPWDFLVPEADEIEDCYENGYPSKERHYKELRNFLMRETEWKEGEIEDSLARIWSWTTQGYDAGEIERDLRNSGRVLADKGKQKEFLRMLKKTQDYTRCLKYRGHMEVQLQRMEIPFL